MRGFAAGDDVDVRASAHDGFGRIAFDWPAPVEYDAQVSNDTLSLHFARPLHAALDRLPALLGDYVASADIEGQGKTLVAHLKRPVTVHAFTIRDKTVVVDLTPAPAAAAAEAPKPEPKPAAPQAAAPKVAEPKPKPAAPTVTPPPSRVTGASDRRG